jgi:hypothetical protein
MSGDERITSSRVFRRCFQEEILSFRWPIRASNEKDTGPWSSQGLPSSGAGLGCCLVIRPGGKSYRCALSAALPHECVARLRKAPARTPIAAAATMEPVRCRRANLRKPVTASPRS